MEVHGRALIAIGAALVALLCFAPGASAGVGGNVYIVDKTDNGDASVGACDPMADNDCTLRRAVSLANSNPGSTINFDPTVFTGNVADSTISVDTSTLILISHAVTIDGGNCGTAAAPKPCVGVDSAVDANSPLEVFTSEAVTIHGLAITGAPGAAGIISQGTTAPTITGCWFGVELDGTTVNDDNTGVSFQSGGSGTIGGTTAADRNVFAASGLTSQAISISNGSNSNTIKGNYIGTLPDGTPTTNAVAAGIVLTGPIVNNTIGGDSATAGHCDGACNLIVGFAGDGIQLVNPGGGAPAGTTIRGNFIGLKLNGTTGAGNSGAGINVGGATGTVIGGGAATQRNYIAANQGKGIVAQGGAGSGLQVTNNYIGLSADGTASIPNTGGTGDGKGVTANVQGPIVTGNRFGGNGLLVRGDATVTGNAIGVGPAGQAFAITGEPGLEVDGTVGTGGVIGGLTPTLANTIGNVNNPDTNGPPEEDGAVFLTNGATNVAVEGNFIGTTSTGQAEPNTTNGILLGGSNAVANNTVLSNVVSNSGEDAIRQSQGGNGNLYRANVGKNNGTGGGAKSIFVDLGGAGLGNGGGGAPNNGILAPTGLSVTSTTASGPAGSALNGAAVEVYATYTSHGDVRRLLRVTGANADGSWSTAPFPALPNGACVTAQQTDGSNNSSEMATAVAVGGGPCVTPPISSIDSGPVNGSTIADSTPTFGFSSEAGATFECKIDSGPFAACSSPFTTSALSDGPHTFTERAVQSTLNAALSPEVGASVSRTFTVDTTGPTASIDSGPAEGATITVPSATFTYSAEAGATFECSVDSGSFGPCSSPSMLASLADGAHTFQVRATDTLGNAGPVATRNFSVDTTPAAVTIDSGPGEGSTITSTTATLGFHSEAGASFECKLDAGSFASCASPDTVSGLAQGAHTFQVRATDAAGNVGAAATRSFSVDSKAPSTTIDKVKVNGSTATVLFGGSGKAASKLTFKCKLDKGKFKKCKSPKRYKHLKAGKHKVFVEAIDAAGNVDKTPAKKKFRVKKA